LVCNATGGTGILSVQWNTGATGGQITGLAPGTYTATVTDANNCSAQSSASINQPTQLTIETVSSFDVCGTSGVNSIQANTSGGTAPIAVVWENGFMGTLRQNLASGTYTATATDANGCSASSSATIPAGQLFTIGVTSNGVTCHGLANGSASVSVISGSGTGVIYQWSTGATGNSVSNLTPGTYIVNATNQSGCAAQATFSVSEPLPLSINIQGTDPSCHGMANGSATATFSGGIAPLNCAWSNGVSGGSIAGIAAGTYTATITDANGCMAQGSFELTQPNLINLMVNSQDVGCFGENSGSANATVSGGVGAISVSWSNGQTGNHASNLGAGSYQVTATDQNGCSLIASATISQPNPLTVSLAASHVSCYGGANGGIVSTVSGGSGTYNYAWSNGLTSASLFDLPVGIYTLTVTDSNGCEAYTQTEIISPGPLVLTGSSTAALCFGESSGSASLTVTGGTSPTSIQWNNGQTGQSISSVPAGNYTAIATDANNCQQQLTITIGQPLPIELQVSTQMPSCFGFSDGAATALATNAGSSVTYSWSTGQSTAAIANLSAGTYLVTATNSAGCSASQQFAISQPQPLTAEVLAFNIACGNSAGGSAFAVPSGGTEPYNFQWSTGDQSDELEGLGAGKYSLTVHDLNNCLFQADFGIIESDALSVGVIVQHPTCFGLADGYAEAMAGGGSGPYSYEWSAGSNSSLIQNLGAGSYVVTATDATGCSGTAEAGLVNPTILVVTAAVTSTETCDALGSAIAFASGGTGTIHYAWSNAVNSDDMEAESGSYVVVVTDANLCQSTASVFIPIDCVQNIPQTFLDEMSCGAQDLSLSATIHCVPVSGAEMYEWNFISEAAGVSYNGFTIGNNPHFQLNQVVGILYGMDLEVSVRARVNNNWGEWGPVCFIFTQGSVPASQLTAEFCGAVDFQFGNTVFATSVAGADAYEWTFEKEATSIVLNSSIPQITLLESMGFANGQTYEVTVRAQSGSQWSQPGPACAIHFQATVGVFDISDENLSIFPNPFDGQNIAIQFGQAATGDVNLDIFNMGGKVVARHKISENANRYDVHFEQKLVSGMYVFKFSMERGSREFKSIVQN
jgi:hypothetical protein